jgi:ribosome biogenesis GTPase
MLRGLVFRSQSGFFFVRTEQGDYVCQIRGRLKQGPRQGDIVAVGDWVQISTQPDGQGMIEEVEERQRMLSRKDPTPKGVYHQIIVANLDQAVFIYACANPTPRLRMLDRFLVIAEKQNIPVLIIANKVDLIGMEKAKDLFGPFEQLGYPVIYTSTRTLQGVEELRQALSGKLSVFAGPSGAGKSSLMNAIQPGLGLAVREISQATGKGQHTTVVRELFPLEFGGYVADTPGLKALALWDVEPDELDGYFPELRELVADCPFSDCTHLHEPGCAVRAALGEGRIHPRRYDSYQRMRRGIKDDD